MGFLFSTYSNAAAGVSRTGVLLIDAVLLVVLAVCAWTDLNSGKILNKVTFPAMGLGLALNLLFGGLHGLLFALAGMILGIALQWVPFMLRFAGAGDVKLLGAVGALKGGAFCTFGFLYGAVAFAFTVPFLLSRAERRSAATNLAGYAQTAAVTQSVPETPTPTVTRRTLPWALGLCIGFVVALAVEHARGRAFWF